MTSFSSNNSGRKDILVCKDKQNIRVGENSMYNLGTKMNHKNIHYIDSKIYNTKNPKTTRYEKVDNNILTVALQTTKPIKLNIQTFLAFQLGTSLSAMSDYFSLYFEGNFPLNPM